MNKLNLQKDIIIEICKHCGRDVSRESYLFVNRIPDLNDLQDRMDANCLYPLGDYCCEECDNYEENEKENKPSDSH